MHRYIKGARYERELLHTLHKSGYSVIRGAGSGVNSLSPDLLAIKKGNAMAFECKAWDRGSLSIDMEQFDNLVEWERNTGMNTYIAWRMNGEGWFFVRLSELRQNEKSYTVTKKDAMSISRKLETIIVQEIA